MAPLRPHASAAHGTAPGTRASRAKNSESQESSTRRLKDDCIVSHQSTVGESRSHTVAELTESSCVPVGQLEHVDGTNRCFQGPAQSDNQSRHQHFNVSKVSVASHSIDAKTAPVVSGSCRLKRKQQSNHCSIEKMMVSGEAITSRHVNAKGHPLKHLKPRQATALPGKENVDPGFRISLSSSSAKARTEESGLLAESVRESLATRWVAEEAHITEECGTGNCNTTNAKAGNVTQDVGESRLSSSVPISDIIPPSMTSANTKRNSCQSDLYSKGMIKARKQVEVKKPTDHRADVSAPPGQQIPMLVENQAADQSFCPKVQVSTLSIQAEECPSVPVARAVPADTEGPLAISASARPADLTNTMLRPLDSVPLVQLVRDDEEIWKEWEGIRLLGEGVYGRVYLVRNRSTQEERAFKRMYLHVRRRSEASEKPVQELAENSSTAAIMAAAGGGTLPAVVQREVTVLRALRGQPNVIPLHGVLIGSHRVYLSFPLVKGGTLSDLLRCFAGWAENLRCNTGKKRQQGSGGPNRPQATPQFPSAGTCLCEALREASQLGAYSGGSGMAGEQRSSAITRASSNVSPEGTHTHSGDSWTSPVSQYTPTNGEINANGEKTRPSQCTELACACPCRRCIPQCGLPLGLCLRVAHALLRGIAACHEKRIVHRDLKPDNVLVQWTEVPMDQTRCRRTLEYMAAVGSVKEGSPTADVLEKRGGPNHIQTSSAKNLVVVAAASAKEPADYVTSLDTSKSTENSQDDDCLLPPPLVQRLYIADFGLARTLPFFTSPYFPKDANSPEVVSSQQLPTPETHDVAGQDTPEMRRTDALVGSPLRNSKQTPSIDDGDGTSGVCLSPEIITLNYRPLEVLLGSSSYTLAVDIWSVGCVVLECLTGREFVDGCCEMSCILHILQTFGTPDEKEWPQLFRLPFMSRLLPSFPKNPHAVEAYLAANGRTDVVQSENWMQMLNLYALKVHHCSALRRVVNSFKAKFNNYQRRPFYNPPVAKLSRHLKLLQVNPDERISAAEALRLPLFASVPDSALL